MSGDGAAQRRCEQTGLSVPECSCRACLEAMLAHFSPELLAGEITVTRLLGDEVRARPRPA